MLAIIAVISELLLEVTNPSWPSLQASTVTSGTDLTYVFEALFISN